MPSEITTPTESIGRIAVYSDVGTNRAVQTTISVDVPSEAIIMATLTREHRPSGRVWLNFGLYHDESLLEEVRIPHKHHRSTDDFRLYRRLTLDPGEHVIASRMINNSEINDAMDCGSHRIEVLVVPR